MLLSILRQRGIRSVRISGDLPYKWVKAMIDHRIAVSVKDYAIERRSKSEVQLAAMADVQRVTEGAFAWFQKMLSRCEIHGEHLILDQQMLTSEWAKIELDRYFREHSCTNPAGMIVASGEQTARPHDDGSGPLFAHCPIIVDLFPQSEKTGYYADMTRTFLKGIVPDAVQEMYDAVLAVQEEIIASLGVGMRCDTVYERTAEALKQRGYETSPERGFMHRTGHGLGLSVHEDPSFLTGFSDIIEPGMVMTVEPGLYYPGIGGVRLEDVIVFHCDGSKENITHFEKNLSIS